MSRLRHLPPCWLGAAAAAACGDHAIEPSAAARLASDDQAVEPPIGVGDLDGDGIDDAVVRTYDGRGDTENDVTEEGRVYVIYGGSKVTGSLDLATRPSLTGIGGSRGDVAAVGDVDGDGLADFLVGVVRPGGCGRSSLPPAGTEPQRSDAYLVYGSATRLTGATPIANVGARLRGSVPCAFTSGLAPLKLVLLATVAAVLAGLVIYAISSPRDRATRR